jgi:hypothetical protein
VSRPKAPGCWLVAILTVALWAVSLVLQWESRDVSTFSAVGTGALNFADAVGTALALLAFPVVGLLIATRRPGSAIGRLLLAIGLGWAALATTASYADYGLRLHPGSLPAADAVAGFSLAIWIVPIGLTGIWVLLLFPDGRPLSPIWSRLSKAGAVSIAVIFAMDLLRPGPMTSQGYPGVRNPFGIDALDGFLHATEATVLLLPLGMAAATVSLVKRFRRGDARERRQIAWLAQAAGVTALVYLVDLVASGLSGSSPGHEAPWLIVLDALVIVGIGLIPVAIGIAVLRHRLYEIDVIVRRTLVYGLLALGITGSYVTGVAVGGTLLRTITGASGAISVTLTTLAVALAVQPFRRLIQRRVDRRFSRSAYDARGAVDAFSDRLREQVDLELLLRDLRGVVADTVAPSHASVWIRPDPPG